MREPIWRRAIRGSARSVSACLVRYGVERSRIELAMAIGCALHSTISPRPFTARTTSIPTCQGLQISQYDLPINVGGYVDLPTGARVGRTSTLRRGHRKVHHLGGSGRIHGAERSSSTTTAQVYPWLRSSLVPISAPRHRPAYASEFADIDRDGSVGRPYGRGIDAYRRQRLGPSRPRALRDAL